MTNDKDSNDVRGKTNVIKTPTRMTRVLHSSSQEGITRPSNQLGVQEQPRYIMYIERLFWTFKNNLATHSVTNNYVNYPWLAPYLQIISSPSMSLSTASEGRPIISSVFSHTSCEVSVLCASSEGFVGRQS